MGARQRRRLKTQEPIELTIDRLSHEGRGIGSHEGKVVFVEGALPSEVVKVRFTASKSSYLEATTLEVLVPSPERVVPPCTYFGQCGGCSLQHLASDAQLRFKEQVLHERLTHAVGEGSYQRLTAISGPVVGYRRKARLAVRWVSKKGKVLVGFREQHSSFITDMASCAVLAPQAAALLPVLSEQLSLLACRDQIPQIEVAIGDAVAGASSIALVLRHLQPLDAADLRRLEELAERYAIDLYLQPHGPDSVHKVFPPGSEERLYYVLPSFGLKMGFHPLDFTQVNAGINVRMLDRAMELLEPQPNERILDLFCGLGNFTLPIASRGSQVIGVEAVLDMVERARENARRNGLTNAEFFCADLTQDPANHVFLRHGVDKVLLDPPRSGALEVLPALAALKPARIVYVSCNPATLARDTAQLDALGYRLQAAGAMDMFPHTSHVEAIALFVPKSKSK